ncbi:MAG: potassium channel protein [Desulfobacterales bacterium]|nr:potassium channel protein [Desulfobacterales bacterium]
MISNKPDVELHHVTRLVNLFGITILYGMAGYFLIEHMTLFESFYMTMITISSVGFSEIKPLSISGRIHTVILIVIGISIGTYTIGILVHMLVEGEISKTFGRKRLEKLINELKGHYIICGYGRIGKIVCKELAAEDITFIVIEQDNEAVEELEEQNYLFLKMDATSEDALIKAGIMNARGIVTAVDSDANNVFITLTAKGMNPSIFIVARASDERNEIKMKRAGASRVVSPYTMGGRRIAQVLKRPTVVDFIDIAMMDSNLGLIMEEAQITKDSSLIGKTLIQSNLRKDFGIIIVAIKKINNDMIFNPMPTEKLEANDIIVILGKQEDVKRMNSIV